MTRLGFWPAFGWSAGFGQQYSAVNAAIKEVAERLSTDLWTIDALWWRVEQEHDPAKHPFEGSTSPDRHHTPTGTPPGKLKGAALTFVCQRCFLSKPISLRTDSASDVCVDCMS
jgi:hypothetical protein